MFIGMDFGCSEFVFGEWRDVCGLVFGWFFEGGGCRILDGRCWDCHVIGKWV